MIFDASKLLLSVNSLETGKRCSGEYSIDLGGLEWNIPDGSPGGEPGVLAIDVTSSGRSIVVEGWFKAVFTAQCARCLEPSPIPISGEVRRVYSSDPSFDDEPDVEPVSHHDGWISIFDAVRESVILAMPMVPLCEKGCKGLCSVCGTNLNRGDCGHLVGE